MPSPLRQALQHAHGGSSCFCMPDQLWRGKQSCLRFSSRPTEGLSLLFNDSKDLQWQKGQLSSPCNKSYVSRAASIPASMRCSVAPDHHLLWTLVTLQERKKNCFSSYSSISDLILISPLFFLLPKQSSSWCVRWAVFIAASLKGC